MFICMWYTSPDSSCPAVLLLVLQVSPYIAAVLQALQQAGLREAVTDIDVAPGEVPALSGQKLLTPSCLCLLTPSCEGLAEYQLSLDEYLAVSGGHPLHMLVFFCAGPLLAESKTLLYIRCSTPGQHMQALPNQNTALHVW